MYLWAADTHFNTCIIGAVGMGTAWRKHYPSAKGLILTGDISNAKLIKEKLRSLEIGLQKPIYFVCGNHDYHGASFDQLDKELAFFKNRNVYYLPALRYVQINKHTVMIGNSGWYDAGYDSNVEVGMSDFDNIEDLKADPIQASKKRSVFLANKIEIAMRCVKKFVKDVRNVIVVNHVPACEYLAKLGDHPAFYGSLAMEKAIMKESVNFEKVIVLSGHTHFPGVYINNNVSFYSGEARRGVPVIAGTFDEDAFTITPFF